MLCEAATKTTPQKDNPKPLTSGAWLWLLVASRPKYSLTGGGAAAGVGARPRMTDMSSRLQQGVEVGSDGGCIECNALHVTRHTSHVTRNTLHL
jgi:hypothetical protein